MDLSTVNFIISVHSMKQLPEESLPEVAFAGRSNVGKSSLMNKLLGRKGLVKVSARPGKTQGLNFFESKDVYFVDLPGYGFAKVPKSMQDAWQKLITGYLESRNTLCCVVVICDLRHPPKQQDTQLIIWLKLQNIPFLPVYTKADKLSGNQIQKHASALDAGHTIKASERIIFSAKTGKGREELIAALDRFCGISKLANNEI